MSPAATLEHRELFRNGAATSLRLHYVRTRIAEPRIATPRVVLLHGFPDFWYSWRHQLAFLGSHGIDAVAPDVRGYNLSDKPRGVEHYLPEVLSDDVQHLISATGTGPVVLVGHDLGALLGYVFAMRYPALVARLVILNCPHPALLHDMARSPRQILKSWYILFFQLPRLARPFLQARNMWALRRTYRTNLHDPLTRAELQQYVDALGGESTAAVLDHYRALTRWARDGLDRTLTPIEVPVDIVWGENDRFIGAEFALPPERWVPHARLELVDAGHWVHLDRPDRVNRVLAGALGLT